MHLRRLVWREMFERKNQLATSFLAILEGTPPSVEFNKGIWRWFAGRLVESHAK